MKYFLVEVYSDNDITPQAINIELLGRFGNMIAGVIQADELEALRAQLAEARELISEARLELEHAVYPIPPSESVCAKLTTYLQKVKSA